MATSGTPPLPPDFEAWSEKDFAAIMAFLRNQIGISLESHRMGLMQARLRSRLQSKGYNSFTQFHEQVLRVEPIGVGHPVADRPEHGQSHVVLPRAGPFHVHGREGCRLAQGVAELDDPDLVGRVLVGPGTVQHGHGPGRDARLRPCYRRSRSGPATCPWRCSRLPPVRSTRPATFRASRPSGSADSSCWAGGLATAPSASSRDPRPREVPPCRPPRIPPGRCPRTSMSSSVGMSPSTSPKTSGWHS